MVNHIGQKFVEPQTADLNIVYLESSPMTPLIFILSQGTDPAADLYKFAEEAKFSKKLSAISLGQGQVREVKCSTVDGFCGDGDDDTSVAGVFDII